MFDEYNTLQDTFALNLSLYGVSVLVNGTPIKALFKRRSDESGQGKGQYLTMFTAYSDHVEQGDTIELDGKLYLALKDNSNENTTYNKTHCIDCNQEIQYELRYADDSTKADLVTFNVHGDEISASVLGGELQTLQSTCHFTFPLNDLTRRINLNDRFFAGQSKTGVWKIRDINYQNNFCEVYCNRSTIDTVNDDPENMIADRWLFERKPDEYKVQLSPDTFTIQEGQTQQLTVDVFKNGEPVEPTPEITYTIDDPTIVSVDPKTNIATGLKEGNATITGSYITQEGDICINAKVTATITPKPVSKDIVVTPPYDDGKDYHSVKQNWGPTTFTATIEGVDSPQWTITLAPQGIPSNNYTSSIDNGAGTFTVECKYLYNGKYLKYTISEATTGKTLDYNVLLAAML